MIRDEEMEVYLSLIRKGAKSFKELELIFSELRDELEKMIKNLEKNGLVLVTQKPVSQIIPLPPLTITLTDTEKTIRILREINSRANAILMEITNKLGETGVLVLNEIKSQENALKNEINDYLMALHNQLEKITNSISEMSKTIIKNFGEYNNQFSQAIDLSKALNSKLESIQAVFNEIIEKEAKPGLDEVKTEIVENVRNNISFLDSIISDTKEFLNNVISLTSSAAKRLDNFKLIVDTTVDNLLSNVERIREASLSKILEALNRAKAVMDTFTDEAINSLYPSLEKELEEVFNTLLDSVMNSMTITLSQYETFAKTLVTEVTERWSTISSSLETQLSPIIGSFSPTLLDVRKSINDLMEESLERMNELFTLLVSKTDELERIIEEVSQKALNNIKTIDTALIEHFDNIRKELLEYYHEIQSVSESYISRLYDDLQTSINSFVSDLDILGEKLNNMIKDYYETGIKTSVKAVRNALELIENLLATSEEIKRGGIEALAEDIRGSVLGSIDYVDKELRERLIRASRRLSGVINATSIKTERIQSEITSKIREFGKASASKLDVLIEFLEKKGITIDDEIRKFIEKQKRSITYDQRGINATVNKCFNEYKQHLARLSEEMINELNALSTDFVKYLRELAQNIVSLIQESASSSIVSFYEKYTKQLEHARSNLSSQLQLFSTTSDEHFKRISEHVNGSLANISNSLKEYLVRERSFQKELIDSLSKAVVELNNILIESLKRMRESIRNRVLETFEQAQKEVKDDVKKEIESTKELLNRELQELKSDIRGEYGRVNSIIERSIDRLNNSMESLKRLIELVNSEIGKSTDRFMQAIDARHKEIQTTLENRRKHSLTLLEERKSILKERSYRMIKDLRDRFDEILDEIREEQEASIKESLKHIGLAAETAKNKLSQRITDLANELSEASKSISVEYENWLTNKENEKNALNQSLQTMITTIEELIREKIMGSLNKLSEGTKRLVEECGEIIEKLDATRAGLEEFYSGIKSYLDQTVKKYREEYRVVHKDLSGKISERIDQYYKSISELISEKIRGLQRNFGERITNEQNRLESAVNTLEGTLQNTRNLAQDFIEAIKEVAERITVIRGQDSILTRTLDIISRTREKIVLAIPFLREELINEVKEIARKVIVEMILPETIALPEELFSNSIIVRTTKRDIPIIIALRDDEEVFMGLLNAEEEFGLSVFSYAAVSLTKLLLKAYLR